MEQLPIRTILQIVQSGRGEDRGGRRLAVSLCSLGTHTASYVRRVDGACHCKYSWLKAKFHYTDPTGPARTQRSFAAKKVRAGPVGSV